MNIFLFCEDLDENAKWFYDRDKRRFNKQIVESTQLFAAGILYRYHVNVIKSDGLCYTVDKIRNHPACKWVMENRVNHDWHCRYLKSLIKLAPNHACAKSFSDAMNLISWSVLYEIPENYLCITNSDMTGLPDDATVFDKYRRHLENKHKGLA